MAKRESKISLFISSEARTLLDAAVLEFDSPQGKLIDRMIMQFCGKKSVAAKVKRSASKVYPSNIEDQFNLLWDTKGKKGAKQKAYQKYRSMMEGENDETCEQATLIFVDDILKHKGECGMPEMHLTTYLNQERWNR